MILVRNVFRIKFGTAKQAKELWREGLAIQKKLGFENGRILTDITGPFYTLVFEITFKSLSDLEQSMKTMMGTKEWGEWYQKFVPLVESGYRELFTIVE